MPPWRNGPTHQKLRFGAGQAALGFLPRTFVPVVKRIS